MDFRFLIVERWRISYRIAYSFERSLLLGNRGALEYISRCKCWSARIEIAQSRSSGVEFALLYRLLGLGQEFAGGSTGLDFLDVN